MPFTNAYGLYGVSVGSTLLGGITNAALNTGTEVRGEASSGELYPRIKSTVAQKPSASWSTRSIAAALSAVPLLGMKIADLTGGLKLYAQKHEAGGTRVAGAAHKQFQVLKGLIFHGNLSAEHQGDAVINSTALITWDGTNNPIIPSESVTPPTGLTDSERFGLGPVTINGVALSAVRSMELALGINAVTEGADGEIWDRFSSIRTIAPVLTLRGIDPDWFKTTGAIPLIGGPGAHADTILYLRKRADGGTFVADGTAEHIRMTAAGLAFIETPMEVAGSDSSELSLVMPLQFDGTNAPVTINTASAIT